MEKKEIKKIIKSIEFLIILPEPTFSQILELIYLLHRIAHNKPNSEINKDNLHDFFISKLNESINNTKS